jgi:hypothetical protein
METSKRARKRKLDTAKTDLEPLLAVLRRAGCPPWWIPKGMRRSAGLQSMGDNPKMNRLAKGGARSSLHFWDEGVLIHPPHQGVCGQHGTEEQRVTSGGLTESPGGTGVSGPSKSGFSSS